MRPVILVVEDEPALREILSDMLERFDYDARLAGTAADAYALAAAERPSAILLDIQPARRQRNRDAGPATSPAP